jgi:uncharacterized membrane protein
MHEGNRRSTTGIAGHTIHPKLVPFPVTLLITVFACDAVSRGTGPAIRATAARWLAAAGPVAAVPAAVTGFAGALGNGRSRALRDLVATIAPSTDREGGEPVYRHRVGVTDAPELRR